MTDATRLRGYEELGQTVAQLGTRHVFGVMGDGNMAFLTVAAGLGVDYHAARHEAGAVAAATGYARVTSEVGVASVTHGPGLTNALTALRAAADLRVPVVLLLGDQVTPFTLQNFDHHGFIAGTGASVIEVRSFVDLAARTREAFDRAVARHGPVVLNVPMTVLESGPGSAVAELAARLRQARRSVILAGTGARLAGVGTDLREVGRLSGALLTTSLGAYGMFAGDDWDAGLCGGFANPTTVDLIGGADIVLVVGASLNSYTTRDGTIFGSAEVVQVDDDPDAVGAQHPVAAGIVADAGWLVPALATELARVPRADAGYRTEKVATQLAAAVHEAVPTAAPTEGVDPRQLMAIIDKVVPADRQVVFGGGHYMQWPATLLGPAATMSTIAAIGAGAIGNELATAVGAAIAHPERTTVCVIGDGALLMSLGELDTVVRMGAPMIVVVMNDSCYGAEVHKLRAYGLPTSLAWFPPVDAAAVFTALGGAALTVTCTEDLDAIAEATARPLLIDARIDTGVVSTRFRRPQQ